MSDHSQFLGTIARLDWLERELQEAWDNPPRRERMETLLNGQTSTGARMVYSDWLDEIGEEERAELVRVQVALAGMAKCGSSAFCSGKWETWRCAKCRAREPFERREQVLRDELVPVMKFHGIEA